MDFIDTMIEMAKAFGPTLTLGVIAFYFMDKKDTRASNTVASIVKSHREDFAKMQTSSERHIKDMQIGYKEDLTRAIDASERHNQKLTDALHEYRRVAACQFKQLERQTGSSQ